MVSRQYEEVYVLTSSCLQPPPWLWLCKGPQGLVSPASILVPELGRLPPGAMGSPCADTATAGGQFLHLTVTQTAEIYKDSGHTAIR